MEPTIKCAKLRQGKTEFEMEKPLCYLDPRLQTLTEEIGLKDCMYNIKASF